MSETSESTQQQEVIGPVALPLDLVSPQLTIRAIATGMFLGGILSLCNIYAGLKIGWGFNMSITAALLSYGFWELLHKTLGTPKWGMLENNINQTAASSAASVSSAGLVAPIPALTMLTGQQLTWPILSIWVFSVCLVGVIVAVGLRRQMLLRDKLPFPSGIATAETLKEMYAKGEEALSRVYTLVGTAVFAGSLKLFRAFVYPIKKWTLSLSFAAAAKLKAAGVGSYGLYNLTFALDPSLLLVGTGTLIGFRTCVSMLLGAIFAWGILGPQLLEWGWAAPGKAALNASWYRTMVKWLLWPGVAMMVTASLTSFAFSWRSIVAALTGNKGDTAETLTPEEESAEVSRKAFIFGLGGAFVLSVFCQVYFFSIALWLASLGVMFTFLLAVVAARVSGETSITPVGAMGKVTQLVFGVLSPGQVAPNLMAANVTGGAASQCADLLHDMKAGHLMGASPRFQAFAQFFGVLSGSLIGSAAYLVLVPNPQKMLLTDEWPAPAVAAWKAVAELFKVGLQAMPEGSLNAIYIAGALGIILAILEKVAPKFWQNFVPSPAGIGLAFIIPAYNSISMFIGGLAALLLRRYAPEWSERFLVVLAAGLIAGESLAGVISAIVKIIQG